MHSCEVEVKFVHNFKVAPNNFWLSLRAILESDTFIIARDFTSDRVFKSKIYELNWICANINISEPAVDMICYHEWFYIHIFWSGENLFDKVPRRFNQ